MSKGISDRTEAYFLRQTAKAWKHLKFFTSGGNSVSFQLPDHVSFYGTRVSLPSREMARRVRKKLNGAIKTICEEVVEELEQTAKARNEDDWKDCRRCDKCGKLQ